MKKRLIILIVALVAASVFAAKVKNVAVVEVVVDANCGACKGIEKSEVSQITAELRRVAVNSLPSDRYKVITKETIQAQSAEVLEECASENCIIKLGDKIGAEYIVKGIISKFGPNFTLSVEMYETKDGTLVAALPDPVDSKDLFSILKKISSVCAVMFKTFANAHNPTPTPTPTPTYQQQANQQPQPKPQYQPPQPPQPTPPAPTPPPQPKYQPPAPTPPAANASTFTDNRDGKTYKTVVIGGKKWMAENLNYQPQSGKSWCYDNNNSNCDKYGRLYDWKTAKTACPAGYHLPSRQEWGRLVDYAGGKDKAGKKLKARSGWKDNGNGTDDYGFSALSGGLSYSNGVFDNAGDYGGWWAVTEDNSDHAYFRSMGYDIDMVGEGSIGKYGGLSVRCVAD